MTAQYTTFNPDVCQKCRSVRVHMRCVERGRGVTIVLACQACGAISEPEKVGMSEEEIEAGKSPAGGFTRAQLKKWGVPWPPPKGWRRGLVEGNHWWKK